MMEHLLLATVKSHCKPSGFLGNNLYFPLLGGHSRLLFLGKVFADIKVLREKQNIPDGCPISWADVG